MPAVMKTMSAPARASSIRLAAFERGLAADVRVGTGAEAVGQLLAELHLARGAVGKQRLGVGVAGQEFRAGQRAVDHRVEGVAAAPAHPDDLDPRCIPVVSELSRSAIGSSSLWRHFRRGIDGSIFADNFKDLTQPTPGSIGRSSPSYETFRPSRPWVVDPACA